MIIAGHKFCAEKKSKQTNKQTEKKTNKEIKNIGKLKMKNCEYFTPDF